MTGPAGEQRRAVCLSTRAAAGIALADCRFSTLQQPQVRLGSAGLLAPAGVGLRRAAWVAPCRHVSTKECQHQHSGGSINESAELVTSSKVNVSAAAHFIPQGSSEAAVLCSQACCTTHGTPLLQLVRCYKQRLLSALAASGKCKQPHLCAMSKRHTSAAAGEVGALQPA